LLIDQSATSISNQQSTINNQQSASLISQRDDWIDAAGPACGDPHRQQRHD
jgi:hypothetical protein